MELTSTFRISGSDTIEGELVVPINWQNAFINLSFDKDSVIAKSKGVVSTTEWEFISKTATFLSDYKGYGLTGGFGVLIGVPFQWELTDDNQREIIFDGYLDLSKATFECDKVTTKSTETKQIDDLNSKVDSFTYEYLLSLGRLTPSDYQYVPYVKLPVQNLAMELVMALIQVTILIIQLTEAIKSLLNFIIGIATFTWGDILKILTQFVYVIFLFAAVGTAIKNLVKLLIQPVKYHAGMTELRLMQVGAEYLGYDFASTILEDDYPNAVIIPEKWNINTQENDDLVTGFTQVDQLLTLINTTTNHTNEQGYYNGTFGDVIRALKIKYNAKIVIEDGAAGGNKVIRFERQDYIKDISELYEIPAIDNNGRYTLNADEFKANYLIEYQLDSSNKAGYLSYDGTVFQATISANNFQDKDLVLMRGLENKSIPFAKGSRKNELTKVEQLLGPLLNTVGGIIGEIVTIWNTVVLNTWLSNQNQFGDLNAVINVLNNLPLAGLDLEPIPTDGSATIEDMPLIDPSVFGIYGDDRIGIMQIEGDFLNIPHNILLTPTANAEISNPFVFESNGELIDLSLYFPAINTSGDFVSNKLIENHDFEAGATNLWNKYHSINSFVPNTNGSTTDLSDSKHNQWVLYDFENVPFCMADYLKVKSNNNITFAGKVGRIESLEWDVYNQKANISFRVNELWTNNLEIKYNEPIGR